MGKILFVTGTDTGVGKTVVSCCLISALIHQGYSAIGLKPFETGCVRQGELFEGEDSSNLAHCSGSLPSDCALYQYQLPLAPSVASRLEQRPPIQLSRALELIHTRTSAYDFVIVEGVGGLMVPLNDHETVLDFAKELNNSATILVAANRLGVLSQTLSAHTIALAAGLKVVGTVLNSGRSDRGLAEQENPNELRRWISPVLEVGSISASTYAEWGERMLEQFSLEPEQLRSVNKNAGGEEICAVRTRLERMRK